MEWEAWRPLYEAIVAEFGFDRNRDEASARALASQLDRRRVDSAWGRAAEALAGRDVTIVGAADSAPDQLRAVPRGTLVAADGATSACWEEGRIPDLIVTDLDGRVEDEVEAARRGAVVAVHAHGDNMEAVREWLPRFPPDALAGTCQTRPVRPLRNHGGFTDGDRAAFIAHALGARRLRLVGFDFGDRVGRFTGRFDPATKARKLAWAKRLLERLAADGADLEILAPGPPPSR